MQSGRGALGERVTLAHELLHNFRALQDPVGHDMRYTAALQVQSSSSRVAPACSCGWLPGSPPAWRQHRAPEKLLVQPLIKAEAQKLFRAVGPCLYSQPES